MFFFTLMNIILHSVQLNFGIIYSEITTIVQWFKYFGFCFPNESVLIPIQFLCWRILQELFNTHLVILVQTLGHPICRRYSGTLGYSVGDGTGIRIFFSYRIQCESSGMGTGTRSPQGTVGYTGVSNLVPVFKTSAKQPCLDILLFVISSF